MASILLDTDKGLITRDNCAVIFFWPPTANDLWSGQHRSAVMAQQLVERSSMNSWDDDKFRAAIEAIGKKNIIIAGLWTEVYVSWPTLNVLAEGYNTYIVEDACGTTSAMAHDVAMRREVQAGAAPMTSIATVLEFQRDWANKEHYNAVLNIFWQHGGAYGNGIDYAYAMVHKMPKTEKIHTSLNNVFWSNDSR